jgi:hypothetical protein
MKIVTSDYIGSSVLENLSKRLAELGTELNKSVKVTTDDIRFSVGTGTARLIVKKNQQDAAAAASATTVVGAGQRHALSVLGTKSGSIALDADQAAGASDWTDAALTNRAVTMVDAQAGFDRMDQRAAGVQAQKDARAALGISETSTRSSRTEDRPAQPKMGPDDLRRKLAEDDARKKKEEEEKAGSGGAKISGLPVVSFDDLYTQSSIRVPKVSIGEEESK